MGEQRILSPLGQQKIEVLRNLLAIMIDSNASPDYRQAAKRSLEHIGDLSIVDMLGQIVEAQSDDQIISDASELLGFMPTTPGTETSLIKLLWHDSPEVRRKAIQSLARVGDQRTASILGVIVSDSQDSATIFDTAEGALAEQARRAILRRSRS